MLTELEKLKIIENWNKEFQEYKKKEDKKIKSIIKNITKEQDDKRRKDYYPWSFLMNYVDYTEANKISYKFTVEHKYIIDLEVDFTDLKNISFKFIGNELIIFKYILNIFNAQFNLMNRRDDFFEVFDIYQKTEKDLQKNKTIIINNISLNDNQLRKNNITILSSLWC